MPDLTPTPATSIDRTRPDEDTVLARRRARKLARQKRRLLGLSAAPAPHAPFCGVPSNKLDPHHDPFVRFEVRLDQSPGHFCKLTLCRGVINLDPRLPAGVLALPAGVLNELGIAGGQMMSYRTVRGDSLELRVIASASGVVCATPKDAESLGHEPTLIAPSRHGVAITLQRI